MVTGVFSILYMIFFVVYQTIVGAHIDNTPCGGVHMHDVVESVHCWARGCVCVCVCVCVCMYVCGLLALAPEYYLFSVYFSSFFPLQSASSPRGPDVQPT